MRAVLGLCLLCSSPALAERLLVCGYELQSMRAGVETDPGDVLGSTFIDSSPVHGGEAVARAVAVSGVRSSFRHYFVSANPAMFARVYVRLEQPVNATTMFLLVRRSGAVPAISWLTVDSQGFVRPRVWVTDYPPIARLTVGQWHRFDIFVDERTPSGSHLVQLAMDGQTVLLVENLALSHIVDTIEVGLNVNAETASSGVMLFDDIAVNGTVGTDENGFPQPGQVFMLRPDGQAGTPAWTNGDGGPPAVDNWLQVSELPPDDGVTMLESRTNARVSDEYTVRAPPPIALSTPASLVMVGARFSADGTTNRSIGVTLRAGAAGALASSPGVSAAVTSWYSNRDDGYLNVPLVAARTPEGQPWTAAALDDLRIGVVDADNNARVLRVTSVFAHVEFPVPTEPPSPIPGARPDGGVDAGTKLPDAGLDAGAQPLDAGQLTDAGTTVDAGSDPDAGSSTDAGSSPDAGSRSDAGNEPDAGGSMTQDDGGLEEPDGGSERGPYVLVVGCGCGAAPEWSMLLALALMLRRAQRKT